MRPYPLIKQQKIIVATTALHNFIRICGVEDEEFNKCDSVPRYMTECEEEMNIDEQTSSYNSIRATDGAMDRVRNQIAVGLVENRNR